MEDFKLITYNPMVPPKDPPAFYILSRGNTTGRPGYEPWRNSLCFYCTPEDAEQYYQYIHSMWLAKLFYTDLPDRGLPYLTVKEMRQLIHVTIGVFEGVESYIEKFYLLIGTDISPFYKAMILEGIQLAIMKKNEIHAISTRGCGRKRCTINNTP